MLERIKKIVKEFNKIPFGLNQGEFEKIIKRYLENVDESPIQKYRDILKKRNNLTLSDNGLFNHIFKYSKDFCDNTKSTPRGYENFTEYRKFTFISNLEVLLVEQIARLEKSILFDKATEKWYNLDGEELLPKTCEYLYGIKPAEFLDMLHPDALKYKILLAKDLNEKIVYYHEQCLDIRCDKVGNSIKHNKELLKEMGINDTTRINTTR